MRTAQEIREEIEKRFGFFPPFFIPALRNPELLGAMWEETIQKYVNNKLPVLHKEALFAYLSKNAETITVW